MPGLMVHPTTTRDWQALVEQARHSIECSLSEQLESYLVFTLMRFTTRPEIVDTVLATEYLHALELGGPEQTRRLRDLGDQCLLYSGLFPGQARRRAVPIAYFVTLGQSAYDALGIRLPDAHGDLFLELSEGFVTLMDVLLALRGRDNRGLDPLDACDLWLDTGSGQARAVLADLTDATPVSIAESVKH